MGKLTLSHETEFSSANGGRESSLIFPVKLATASKVGDMLNVMMTHRQTHKLQQKCHLG